jgi:anhydro-N-acetylmuramic acid kinase
MQKYRVLGLMSGTSLDGLDLALCTFWYIDDYLHYQIENAETIVYSQEWEQLLSKAHELSGEQLIDLHHKYGEYLGICVDEFINSNRIEKSAIDLVSSHGHTIFHQPQKGFTFQLGHGASLAKTCGLSVVSDLRTQDVVLGGQGAPLVPIGDRLLFGEYDYCLNIGGIANVSFEKSGKRMAWDICPANMVLNYFSNRIGKPFDENGKLASEGVVNGELLKQLNSLDFYKLAAPKTLGREWVFGSVIPLIEAQNISIKDTLSTFAEHIAFQVSKVFENECNKSLLITGGGAYNSYLIDRINNLSDIIVKIPDSIIIEYKEALIFALLGFLKTQGKNNILSSVTGAVKDHSSGILYDY